MDHQDRELILGLANRLRQAPPVPQDPQAAELIAQEIAAQPNSVYLLVQAVLVQEDELRQAQARIAAMAQQSPGPTSNPAFTTQAGHTSSPTFTPNPAFTTQPGYALQPGHGHHAAHGYDPHTGQSARGGFMSRMFGRDRDDLHPQHGQQPGAGGGFVKTAAAAAAGVAGGALLVAGANELFSDAPANQAQGQDGDGFSVMDLF
ncbi:DUF2076 domain-containing protein [Lentzea terrae]|uniref:DUF2076 domain-containing protein n=1 Tax=Lentzea terrae TaxID=2200761 RepID=UPI000DD40282|nr:DUF2076 family protein [Lentzea terrae]